MCWACLKIGREKFVFEETSCHYTPRRDGTRNAARRPRSGGRPRGCRFEEQGGGMCAYIEGVYPYTEGSLSPIAILSVCLCVHVVL